MADSLTVRKVRELAEPLCDGLGLFLWDVKFEKEGANWYLRVYIDKDGGIQLSDCEALHRPLDQLLDETDPIPQSYVFEVCSPGLGRKLERPEHFEVCFGDEVKIRFIRPRNGVKEIIAELLGYDGDNKTIYIDWLSADGTVMEDGPNDEWLPLAECAFVKLNDDVDLFGGIEQS